MKADPGGTSPGRLPNVLWIMADQLRYHALSCHGDPNVATPAIDALAAEGVDCSEAVSQYPVCTPFRAALMTGQHANLNGVMRHGDFLDPNARTVAHAFRDAGYRTSYVGKWHLAPESGAAAVDPRGWAGQDFWVHPRLRGGFQDWFGFNLSNNYYETYIASGEKVRPRRLEGYQTDALTDLSIEYLEGLVPGRAPDRGAPPPDDAPHPGAGPKPPRPWFHVISYESPHPGRGGPPGSGLYPVPERYASLFEPGSLQLRPNVPPASEAASREQLAGYYRLITNLDDNVGRLLAWLEGSGQARDTLVVFFSDHGEMGGSHGLRDKQVPYEESLHIPLVFRLPGRGATVARSGPAGAGSGPAGAGSGPAGAGSGSEGAGAGWAVARPEPHDTAPIRTGLTYHGLVSGVDIAPTTLGLCGLPPLEGSQGIDHSAELRRLGSPGQRDAVLVQWEDTRFRFGDHPYRALRDRRYTYVLGRDEAYCLLFDRERDPYELDNLFGRPETEALRRDLDRRLVALIRDAGEELPAYVSSRVDTSAVG